MLNTLHRVLLLVGLYGLFSTAVSAEEVNSQASATAAESEVVEEASAQVSAAAAEGEAAEEAASRAATAAAESEVVEEASAQVSTAVAEGEAAEEAASQAATAAAESEVAEEASAQASAAVAEGEAAEEVASQAVTAAAESEVAEEASAQASAAVAEGEAAEDAASQAATAEGEAAEETASQAAASAAESEAAEEAAEVTEDDARDALAVSEEDEDANTLEEALTAVDQNYSLIEKGSFGLHYGHNFTYSSSDSLLLSSQNGPQGGNPIDISRDARYTHSTRLTGSYGLRNNLTLGVGVPFVSSVRAGSTARKKVEDDGLGDVSLSLRWQPWPIRAGKANTTFSAGVTLPTGTDPYKIETKNTVATGSGGFNYSLGANISKTIDPIIAYGGISLSRAADRSDLNQKRGDRYLQGVKPQFAFSYNMGIGYALSYGVSMNMGFQHTFGSKTELEFSNKSRDQADGSITSFESIGGHSALFNISAGFRTAASTVLSVNLGIGLTRESPDFTLGFSMPFSIEGLKSYFVDE